MTNYDYASAAEALGVSEAWLRDRTPRELPHIKFGGRGGRVIFTDEHLEQIRKQFQVNMPDTAPAAHEMRPASRRRSS